MAMPPQQMPQGQPQGQPPQGGQRPTQQPPQQAQGQPQGQPQGQGPGEQTEALLDAMTAYLYETGMKQAKQVLQQGEDIVERMSLVIGTVLTTTYKALNQQGKGVDPRAFVRAGMELSKAVGEMAETMGRLEEGDSETIEMAFMSGLARFGKQVKNMPDEERQVYAKIIDTLVQAKDGPQGQPQQSQEQQPPQQPAPGATPQQRPQGGLLQGAM